MTSYLFFNLVCKKYKGENLYENKHGVVDSNLITTSGITPLEFIYELIKKIKIMENNTLEACYNLYKTKKNKIFF